MAAVATNVCFVVLPLLVKCECEQLPKEIREWSQKVWVDGEDPP